LSFGDEIMASGHALAEHRRTGRPIRIVGADGRPLWSDLWRDLPWIVQPGASVAGSLDVANGPGCRPYIRYPFTRALGCTYSGWRARDHVGSIVFSDEEIRRARDVTASFGRFALLEPNLDPRGNPNKQWGWDRWQSLVDLTASVSWVQLSHAARPQLQGVASIETGSFRSAAAVLSLARMAVLPEGGLHHAAGALGIPAVVLFGGAVDVEATGYPHHDNVVDRSPGSPCGRWMPCEHCRDVWATISPAEIAARVLKKWSGDGHDLAA
jgi:hypothetical protein